MSFHVTTLQQRPDLERHIDRLSQEAWPKFLLHGNMRYWSELFSTFAGYQILLYSPEEDSLIGVGHTIPFVWDGATSSLPADMDAIMVRAMHAHNNQQQPTALSALAVIVDRAYRGKGFSAAILQEMKALAATHSLSALLAPVRPTHKSAYPLTPMQRYLEWKRPDGSPFDPWIRTHWRLGASILQIMHAALIVTGTVLEWEQWADMSFPESGRYIVPGALEPVNIDYEQDVGRYVEPNIWMLHPVEVIN
jgi:GNAT superfamily N-acetyltransferase